MQLRVYWVLNTHATASEAARARLAAGRWVACIAAHLPLRACFPCLLRRSSYGRDVAGFAASVASDDESPAVADAVSDSVTRACFARLIMSPSPPTINAAGILSPIINCEKTQRNRS
mmetsp:Transcript_11597/g.22333  ORF Transcript_11597/g.22333 Transcript_11597/m.22333 type:complete len:117 (+) Transcript_11597:70-420(+)